MSTNIWVDDWTISLSEAAWSAQSSIFTKMWGVLSFRKLNGFFWFQNWGFFEYKHFNSGYFSQTRTLLVASKNTAPWPKGQRIMRFKIIPKLEIPISSRITRVSCRVTVFRLPPNTACGPVNFPSSATQNLNFGIWTNISNKVSSLVVFP